MIVAGIAITAAVTRNRSIEIVSVFVPFALFVMYAILTWVIIFVFLDRPEYSPRASLVRLKSSLADNFLTLAVFFYGVLNRKDALWLLKRIIVLIVITNAVTIIDSFNVPNLGLLDSRARDGRFIGFMGAANDYGMLLVFFMPLSIALYLSSTGKARLLAGIGAVLTGFCLVLTASRGAYVGAIGGLLLSAVFLRRYVSVDQLIRGTVLSLVFLTLLIPIIAFIGYSDLFVDRFDRFEGNLHTASSGRTTFWLNALKVMAETPTSFITGFGFEAYEFSRDFSAAMHNHYLKNLFNLGLIGLCLFLAVFAAILSIIRKAIAGAQSDSRPFLIALLIGLLCLLVTQIFGQYYRSSYLIWACLGVGLRLAMEVMRDSAQGLGPEIKGRTDSRTLLQPISIGGLNHN
jgi:O-antigen ligase